MQWQPSRTMVRIIELLRDGPRDRAAIASALKLREPATAAVLTTMEFRQIVLKDANLYSLRRWRDDDTLSASIEALIGDAREAGYNDETIAAALKEAAVALREGLTLTLA